MLVILARLAPFALAFCASMSSMTLELAAPRLVARHVGSSLVVWTSVIGVMLAGICLGNVLGGRLADRAEPKKVVGPLFGLGAALTVLSLWMNAIVGNTPGVTAIGFNIWTVVVVSLDFLAPATVLGMIGPVVAKLAIEQAREKRSGSAIGNVYFWGAVGSVLGTYLTGFHLTYLAPTSMIVTVVAALLAVLAAASATKLLERSVALLAAGTLAAGALGPVGRALVKASLKLGAIQVNAVALASHALTFLLGFLSILALLRAVRAAAPVEEIAGKPDAKGRIGKKVSLRDLAALSFFISLSFMALEMTAGRLVSRHLGSSLYGWTSVIVVLLGGLSLGNLIGGKLADFVTDEKGASWLFLTASFWTLTILATESVDRLLIKNPFGHAFKGEAAEPIFEGVNSVLKQGVLMTGYPWGLRVLTVVTAVFFLPAVTMGTVSPLVVKLAVDRLKSAKRAGSTIGQVYAWGMVGSLLGTFLTGFVLIDLLGTKGVILALAAGLALAAVIMGTTWHAAWAGIPLGLCLIAFLPFRLLPATPATLALSKQAERWGLKEDRGDLSIKVTGIAYADESNYYYIKVDNEPLGDTSRPGARVLQKRTLVLDNLIHGYFVLEHPEIIEYAYEHIYALVTRRFADGRIKASAGKLEADSKPALSTMFIGGGAYTFPRHLQHEYPGTLADVAEIDPSVTKANFLALGLSTSAPITTIFGDARRFVELNLGKKRYDLIFGDAFNDFSVPWHMTTKEFNDMLYASLADDGVYMINIIDMYMSDEEAIRLFRLEKERQKTLAETAAMLKKLPPSKDVEERLASNEKERKRSLLRETLRITHEPRDEKEAVEEARKVGTFVSAWVKTARETFPYVYVFGTDTEPGGGTRETYVGVVAKKPLDLAELGLRVNDPKFFREDGTPVEPVPYSQHHLDELDVRARGIILTDDYAPVENLLAPVAATRGEVR